MNVFRNDKVATEIDTEISNENEMKMTFHFIEAIDLNGDLP